MKKILFILGCCLLPFLSWASDDLSFPRLTGQVVDEAGILSPRTKQKILATMKPQQQFVVVTLKSLRGKSIEEYGVALGRHWGIGDAQKNDGLLLIIAPNERKTRIEVGYGLEHIMTDAQASYIIQNVLLPAFKKNQYEAGTLNAVYSIQRVLGGFHYPQVIHLNNSKKNKSSLSSSLPLVTGIGFFWLLMLFFMPQIVINNLKKKSLLDETDRKNLRRAYQIRFLIIICFILMALNIVIWGNALICIGLIIIPHLLVVLKCQGPGIQSGQSGGKSSGRNHFGGGGGSFGGGGGSSFGGGGGSFGGGGSSGSW